jgi:hypothetical protein
VGSHLALLITKRVHSTCDTVFQLLAHDRWFSPGTPASFTTKTGRHDIAEILLKVALNTENQSITIINNPHLITLRLLSTLHP